MGIKVEMTEGKEAPPEVAQKPVEKEVVAEVKKTEEPRYVKVEDLDKINQALNNTREYNNRKLAEINEKLEKLVPKKIESAEDDLDKVVQENWQLGVEKVIERVLTAKEKRELAQSEEKMTVTLLEQSKAKVMAKHPELNDPESPKTKAFMKVLEENPDFKTNPRGPLLAAYEMESLIKAHGTIESGDQRVDRQTRSRGASVPPGTSAGVNRTITLTKEQMEFCRHNGINPENYKRNLGLREARA